MSEISDLVMPVLQKIQKDVADGFRRTDVNLHGIAEDQLRHREKLDAIEGYLTFHMGLTTRQQADIDLCRRIWPI